MTLSLNDMDSKLLELLVCPVSKAPLVYRRERNELWCRASALAYPIRDEALTTSNCQTQPVPSVCASVADAASF